MARVLARSAGESSQIGAAAVPRVENDRAACELGLEGIVSKKRTAPYRSGRSPDWIKVKNPSAPAVTRVLEEHA